MSASSSNALFANRSVLPSLPPRGLLAPRPEYRPASADPVRDGAIRVESLPGQDTVRRLQHVRGYPAVSLLLFDQGEVESALPVVLAGERQLTAAFLASTYPARLTADELSLRPAPAEGGRGVVADAIGELAWAVRFYGGDIIVVPERTLVDFDGIALVLDDEPAPAS